VLPLLSLYPRIHQEVAKELSTPCGNDPSYSKTYLDKFKISALNRIAADLCD